MHVFTKAARVYQAYFLAAPPPPPPPPPQLEIPNVDDHISKLEHMGKETVKKLQDIRGSAAAAGMDVNVPDNQINKGGPAGAHANLSMHSCFLPSIRSCNDASIFVESSSSSTIAERVHACCKPPPCPPCPPAVGEFRKLALLAEADGHLRQKLQQVGRALQIHRLLLLGTSRCSARLMHQAARPSGKEVQRLRTPH